MRPLVDTVLEDPRWEGFGLPALAERAARETLGALGLDPLRYEISLLGCNDARIAELNADFRGKSAPTNVLSWPAEDLSARIEGDAPERPDQPQPDSPDELGDIAIAWETCMREAAEQDKDAAEHVTHLIVHGTLHLLGYDHIRDGDAELMERLEVRILASLGVGDPYSPGAGSGPVDLERNDGQ